MKRTIPLKRIIKDPRRRAKPFVTASSIRDVKTEALKLIYEFLKDEIEAGNATMQTRIVFRIVKKALGVKS